MVGSIGARLLVQTGIAAVDAAARTLTLSTGEQLPFALFVAMPANLPPEARASAAAASAAAAAATL
jgi:hypothetical protein